MYRMAILAIVVTSEDTSLDADKVIAMALVHDIAEAQTGDLTPLCKVPEDVKHDKEQRAMDHFMRLLHNSPAATRISGLWKEYEARKTPEARLVKDLDRFELCLQALEYEYGASVLTAHDIRDLQPFYESAIAKIESPRVQHWARLVAHRRATLWKARGVVYS